MPASGSIGLAVRALGRQPAWTASVGLSLGLGLGATVAVFNLVNAALLRPLPYPDPEGLVLAWESRPDRGWNRFGVSGPAFRDWQQHVSAFDRVVAYHESEANVASDQGAERVKVVSVTADLLPTLGLRPHLGRGFAPNDERAGADAVLLSFGFWQRAFGGDPKVLGRTLRLGRESVNVVGVLPPEVGAPFARPSVFRPLALGEDERRGARWLTVLARLAPGSTSAQARAELHALSQNRAQEFPDTNTGWTVTTAGLSAVAVEDSRQPLLLLSGTVGLLLLLCCANVAHLLLVRTLGRERELAVCSALGASRWRLARPVLSEALVLGLLGGGLGLVLAVVGRGLMQKALLNPESAALASLDLRVFAFGLVVTLATAVLVSLLPVLHVYRTDASSALRRGGTTVVTLGQKRSRRALVVTEVAIAFVMLSAAGVLVRSVQRLLAVDPGFRPEGALTFRVAPPQVAPAAGQSEEAFVAALFADRDRAAVFYAQLLERLRALPGVRAAAAVNRLPLTGGWWIIGFEIPGRAPQAAGDDRNAFGRAVTPGYFATMGMTLRAGRDFDDQDANGRQPVVIVDEAFVQREFEGRSPLGASLRIDERTLVRIVGVVEATRVAGLDRPVAPTFYVPLAQAEFGFYPDWGMDVVLRAPSGPQHLLPLVRDVLRELDPTLPAFAARGLDELVEESLGARRGVLRLLGAFSALALLQATIGLYGVLAQLARERSREFGVRLALGAGGPRLAASLLADGLRLTALGALIGVGGALVAGRALQALLHGVGPGDPLSLAGAAALLGGAATAASLPSVRRVLRLDPAGVLREE